MIYTIFTEDGTFGVNREFRKIDLSEINPDISVVQFDTVRETGVIQWKQDVYDEVLERDLEAERVALARAVNENKDPARIKPMFRRVRVHRSRKVISSFEEFERFLPLWRAAVVETPDADRAPGPVEDRIPLVEVVKLLVRKGFLTAEDVEFLKSTVKE